MVSVLTTGPIRVAADESAEESRLSGLALQGLIDAQIRIMRIADRIRIAGAPFCGREVGTVTGVYTANRYTFAELFQDMEFAKPFIETANATHDLRREPRILAIVPDSAGDRAGLQQGDLIVRIGNEITPSKMDLDSPLDGPQRETETLRIEILRSADAMETTLRAPLGCALPSRYWYSTEVNAFAARRGKLTGLYITAGLLDFMESDDDLAVVVGHELAHLILGHAGTLRTSRRYEEEADRLGLYLAARAGFSIARAAEIWESFALISPLSTIDWGYYTHPTSSKRFIALSRTIEEIRDKVARGVPLLPAEK